MAGSSMTFTRKKIGDVLEVKAVWVSDNSAGTASGSTAFEVVGLLMRVTTVPDGGGTAPSAYSITAKDQNGIDILNGLGAARSTTATESKTNIDGCLLCAATALTVAVTGAGNSKGGTAYFVFADMGSNPL